MDLLYINISATNPLNVKQQNNFYITHSKITIYTLYNCRDFTGKSILEFHLTWHSQNVPIIIRDLRLSERIKHVDQIQSVKYCHRVIRHETIQYTMIIIIIIDD